MNLIPVCSAGAAIMALCANGAVLRVGAGGAFATIQAAVDAAPEGSTIEIAPGEYEEHVYVPKSKPSISLRAAVRGTVKIKSGESVYTIKEKGLPRAAALTVDANGFSASGIVFENYASRASIAAGGRGAGQAQAVAVRGDDVSFTDCSFLGHHNTLMADSPHRPGAISRQRYKGCYIEGSTDFIYGGAQAVFEDCHLHFVARGYLTAASTPQGQEKGFEFVRCKVTAAPGIKKSHLGRPWRPYAKVVFKECEFNDVIAPEGWSNWRNPKNEKTAFFAEYACTGPGADTSHRPPWIHLN